MKEIKIEFYDENGTKVRQTRFIKDSEIIDIVSSLVRAKEPQKNAATVTKLCESNLFKIPLQNHVLQHFSQAFSDYLSCENCPLNNKDLFMDFEDLVNVDQLMNAFLRPMKFFQQCACCVLVWTLTVLRIINTLNKG